MEKTNFLHFSQIKIMGTWGELSKGQPVSHVACGNATTVVVIPPLKDPVYVVPCGAALGRRGEGRRLMLYTRLAEHWKTHIAVP